MFGREPVVDREDGTAAVPREMAAEPVVGLDAPQHEPAAVEKHDRGKRAVVVR